MRTGKGVLGRRGLGVNGGKHAVPGEVGWSERAGTLGDEHLGSLGCDPVGAGRHGCFGGGERDPSDPSTGEL